MARKLALPMLLIVIFALNVVGVVSVGAQEGLATEVRFAQYAADAPEVDVYLNGDLLVEAYQPTWVSGFENVEPGTVDMVITEAGEGIDSPLVKASNIEVEDGHGYTVVLMGQAGDRSLHTLVIDENEAIGDCDVSRNVVRIIVNNVQGSPPLSMYEGNELRQSNIEYGDYSAACMTPFAADTSVVVAGDDVDDVMLTFDDEVDGHGFFWEPYMVYIWGVMGEYPGEDGVDFYFDGYDWYSLAPDPISFLESFSGWNLTYDSELYLEFDQVLQLFRDTGLDEVIENDGPFTLFMPTDQALEALPDKTLNRLLADPDLLRDALLYHMIDGVYYDDDLREAGSLETMQGTTMDFVFYEDDENYIYLDDLASVEDYEYGMLDGSVVYIINDLDFLLPN